MSCYNKKRGGGSFYNYYKNNFDEMNSIMARKVINNYQSELHSLFNSFSFGQHIWPTPITVNDIF